jgi:solute carrier family 25 (mitochondrial 2-oxodicarboxylate transporter), member 21
VDLAKTRIQLARGRRSKWVMETWRDILQEGGVTRLYRGLLPPLLSEVPRRALKFTSNEYYKGLLAGPDRGWSSA